MGPFTALDALLVVVILPSQPLFVISNISLTMCSFNVPFFIFTMYSSGIASSMVPVSLLHPTGKASALHEKLQITSSDNIVVETIPILRSKTTNLRESLAMGCDNLYQVALVRSNTWACNVISCYTRSERLRKLASMLAIIGFYESGDSLISRNGRNLPSEEVKIIFISTEAFIPSRPYPAIC